ncbi:hypothetical protein GCM10028825_20660 [Spirosoma agri]
MSLVNSSAKVRNDYVKSKPARKVIVFKSEIRHTSFYFTKLVHAYLHDRQAGVDAPFLCTVGQRQQAA